MTLRESIVSRTFDAVEKITVRSALNPILWLCGLVTLPCVLVSSAMAAPPAWLTWLAFLPVGAALVGFVFLLLFDRDKLQSESYQLRKQALELIEEKGDVRTIDARTIEVISNPDLAALTDKSQGGRE